MALVPAVQTAQVIQQVQEIPTVTTPRQQLVYFLLACIPVLLNSLMYENKTLGYILLTFFFGLMYRDPSLVNDMKRVLQALTNTR